MSKAKHTGQPRSATDVSLFLCGDVMTGRGIDQILPYPSEPTLHESYVKNAQEYVRLAEKTSGAIPKPADFAYVWGDVIRELEQNMPDVRIINLETSVTKSNDYWKAKEIHYRTNPQNMPCITTAKIDFCSLANNHVLDWGYAGLTETMATLKKAKLKSSGAGENLEQASAPAVADVANKGRALLFAYGALDSGIPPAWAADANKPGVNLLHDYSAGTVQSIKETVKRTKKQNDVAVFSIHWGANWGYIIPPEHREFVHQLIDEANVDVVHGHSSHHVKGIEVYAGKLILYGCGDFLNDYEGIGSYDEFRGDLGLMYFADVEPSTGKLISLRMAPTQIKRFRVNRAARTDAEWLKTVLNREGEKLGTSVALNADGNLKLSWS